MSKRGYLTHSSCGLHHQLINKLRRFENTCENSVDESVRGVQVLGASYVHGNGLERRCVRRFEIRDDKNKIL